MKKILFTVYHKLYFYWYSKGHINMFSVEKSRQIAENKIFKKWLRISSKYIIECWLDSFYQIVKQYDSKNTNGISQFPKQLMEVAKYGYLVRHIMMGYCSVLNPDYSISIEEVLDLNPHKKDKEYHEFLICLLHRYEEQPDKRITKRELDSFLK